MVRLFGGFIGRVQHNYLWDVMPATRQLLTTEGCSLEVFAEYRRRFPPLYDRKMARDGKIRRFMKWLERSQIVAPRPGGPVVRDLIRHERWLWELKRCLRSKRKRPHAGMRWVSMRVASQIHAVPRLSRLTRIDTYHSNPWRVSQQVLGGHRALVRSSHPRHVGYVLEPSTGRIRILRLPEMQYELLIEVDGKRTIAELLGRGSEKTIEKRARYLHGAIAEGLLEFTKAEMGWRR
jgi:hypothetical protein